MPIFLKEVLDRTFLFSYRKNCVRMRFNFHVIHITSQQIKFTMVIADYSFIIAFMYGTEKPS